MVFLQGSPRIQEAGVGAQTGLLYYLNLTT
jgi:hypothetical protein